MVVFWRILTAVSVYGRCGALLLTHPLAAQLQACDTPSSILVLLRQQVQELDRSQSSDGRLTKWLDPTVNVLYALSATLGEGVEVVSTSTDGVRVTMANKILVARSLLGFRAIKTSSYSGGSVEQSSATPWEKVMTFPCVLYYCGIVFRVIAMHVTLGKDGKYMLVRARMSER